MKQQIIVKAKTEQEALENATKQVDCKQEDMAVELVEKGKKGLFKTEPSTYKVTYILSPCDAAKTFIDIIAKDMELDITTTFVQNDDNNVTINLSGEDASTLIGHHGDTLDAFQYIVNLVANKKDSETRQFTRFSIDIENYREKREEALKQLALRIADKVLKTKRYVILEPMNAYERRIIHSTIQGVEGVSTKSTGPEGNRKVIVFLESQNTEEDVEQSLKHKNRNNHNGSTRRQSNQRTRKSYSNQNRNEQTKSTQTYSYNADKAHTPPRKIEKAKDLDSYFAKLKEFSISLQENEESEETED